MIQVNVYTIDGIQQRFTATQEQADQIVESFHMAMQAERPIGTLQVAPRLTVAWRHVASIVITPV